MLKSMTGFGNYETIIEVFEIGVSIKSVNHRYSDFYIRTPRYYSFLEERVRAFAAKYISRGKVEISITINQKTDDTQEVTVNAELAKSYIEAFKTLAALGLDDDLRASTLTRFPDVFKVEYKKVDEDKLYELVETVLQTACEQFVRMRRVEGERMKAAIDGNIAKILSQLEFVKERSPITVAEYGDKLRERIERTLESYAVTLDEARLLTEVAIFADKVAVSEETVRLASHITEFEKTLESSEPIGKKLDFIVQEMNREVNTIGSKANDLQLTKCVVEIKSEIEKIREQIQNIE